LKKIHFIINRLSPRAQHIEQVVRKQLEPNRFLVVFKFSKYKGHSIELAKNAVNEGADLVVACGGDGTVNEVAQCLVKTNTALAILPVGSGNGLARHLCIPTNLSRALDLIKRFEFKTIDVGQANQKYFFCNISFAFSAQVIHCYDELSQRGFKAYSRSLFKAVSSFKYNGLKIQDKESIRSSTPFVLLISNTDQLGYNKTLTPKASLFDGKLDLIQVERYNPLLLGFFMFFAFFRKFPPLTKVNRQQLEEITLHFSNYPVNIQIDGEKSILEEPRMHISIIQKGLKIIC